MLVLLRVLQGFSAGGEWGGAALMSVEHAPANKRGLFGAYPQIGVPLGLMLATGTMFTLQKILGQEAFLEWGWRIPFLMSILLNVVGYLIRRAVEESPVFVEMQERKQESAAPLRTLMTKNRREIVMTALIFMANNAAGYLLIAFFVSYVSKRIGMEQTTALLMTTIAAVGWLGFTLFGGYISDRIGRVRTFQLGYLALGAWAVPMWFLIDSGNPALYLVALLVLTVGLGLSYGPQSALYAEMFPADVRFSGVSIGYALGAILGGAFAPLIAELLLDNTGRSWAIGVYIMTLSMVSFLTATLLQETRGVPLDEVSK